MSLDFNTLEVPKAENLKEAEKTGQIGGVVGKNKQAVGQETAKAGNRRLNSVITTLVILLCLALSLASVILSLFSIKNIPEPKPISIQCDPNLLQKIERQAQILEEISKSAKVQK